MARFVTPDSNTQKQLSLSYVSSFPANEMRSSSKLRVDQLIHSRSVTQKELHAQLAANRQQKDIKMKEQNAVFNMDQYLRPEELKQREAATQQTRLDLLSPRDVHSPQTDLHMRNRVVGGIGRNAAQNAVASMLDNPHFLSEFVAAPSPHMTPSSSGLLTERVTRKEKERAALSKRTQVDAFQRPSASASSASDLSSNPSSFVSPSKQSSVAAVLATRFQLATITPAAAPTSSSSGSSAGYSTARVGSMTQHLFNMPTQAELENARRKAAQSAKYQPTHVPIRPLIPLAASVPVTKKPNSQQTAETFFSSSSASLASLAPSLSSSSSTNLAALSNNNTTATTAAQQQQQQQQPTFLVSASRVPPPPAFNPIAQALMSNGRGRSGVSLLDGSEKIAQRDREREELRKKRQQNRSQHHRTHSSNHAAASMAQSSADSLGAASSSSYMSYDSNSHTNGAVDQALHNATDAHQTVNVANVATNVHLHLFRLNHAKKLSKSKSKRKKSSSSSTDGSVPLTAENLQLTAFQEMSKQIHELQFTRHESVKQSFTESNQLKLIPKPEQSFVQTLTEQWEQKDDNAAAAAAGKANHKGKISALSDKDNDVHLSKHFNNLLANTGTAGQFSENLRNEYKSSTVINPQKVKTLPSGKKIPLRRSSHSPTKAGGSGGQEGHTTDHTSSTDSLAVQPTEKGGYYTAAAHELQRMGEQALRPMSSGSSISGSRAGSRAANRSRRGQRRNSASPTKQQRPVSRTSSASRSGSRRNSRSPTKPPAKGGAKKSNKPALPRMATRLNADELVAMNFDPVYILASADGQDSEDEVETEREIVGASTEEQAQALLKEKQRQAKLAREFRRKQRQLEGELDVESDNEEGEVGGLHQRTILSPIASPSIATRTVLHRQSSRSNAAARVNEEKSSPLTGASPAVSPSSSSVFTSPRTQKLVKRATSSNNAKPAAETPLAILEKSKVKGAAEPSQPKRKHASYYQQAASDESGSDAGDDVDDNSASDDDYDKEAESDADEVDDLPHVNVQVYAQSTSSSSLTPAAESVRSLELKRLSTTSSSSLASLLASPEPKILQVPDHESAYQAYQKKMALKTPNNPYVPATKGVSWSETLKKRGGVLARDDNRLLRDLAIAESTPAISNANMDSRMELFARDWAQQVSETIDHTWKETLLSRLDVLDGSEEAMKSIEHSQNKFSDTLNQARAVMEAEIDAQHATHKNDFDRLARQAQADVDAQRVRDEKARDAMLAASQAEQAKEEALLYAHDVREREVWEAQELEALKARVQAEADRRAAEAERLRQLAAAERAADLERQRQRALARARAEQKRLILEWDSKRQTARRGILTMRVIRCDFLPLLSSSKKEEYRFGFQLRFNAANLPSTRSIYTPFFSTEHNSEGEPIDQGAIFNTELKFEVNNAALQKMCIVLECIPTAEIDNKRNREIATSNHHFAQTAAEGKIISPVHAPPGKSGPIDDYHAGMLDRAVTGAGKKRNDDPSETNSKNFAHNLGIPPQYNHTKYCGYLVLPILAIRAKQGGIFHAQFQLDGVKKPHGNQSHMGSAGGSTVDSPESLEDESEKAFIELEFRLRPIFAQTKGGGGQAVLESMETIEQELNALWDPYEQMWKHTWKVEEVSDYDDEDDDEEEEAEEEMDLKLDESPASSPLTSAVAQPTSSAVAPLSLPPTSSSTTVTAAAAAASTEVAPPVIKHAASVVKSVETTPVKPATEAVVLPTSVIPVVVPTVTPTPAPATSAATAVNPTPVAVVAPGSFTTPATSTPNSPAKSKTLLRLKRQSNRRQSQEMSRVAAIQAAAASEEFGHRSSSRGHVRSRSTTPLGTTTATLTMTTSGTRTPPSAGGSRSTTPSIRRIRADSRSGSRSQASTPERSVRSSRTLSPAQPLKADENAPFDLPLRIERKSTRGRSRSETPLMMENGKSGDYTSLMPAATGPPAAAVFSHSSRKSLVGAEIPNVSPEESIFDLLPPEIRQQLTFAAAPPVATSQPRGPLSVDIGTASVNSSPIIESGASSTMFVTEVGAPANYSASIASASNTTGMIEAEIVNVSSHTSRRATIVAAAFDENSTTGIYPVSEISFVPTTETFATTTMGVAASHSEFDTNQSEAAALPSSAALFAMLDAFMSSDEPMVPSSSTAQITRPPSPPQSDSLAPIPILVDTTAIMTEISPPTSDSSRGHLTTRTVQTLSVPSTPAAAAGVANLEFVSSAASTPFHPVNSAPVSPSNNTTTPSAPSSKPPSHRNSRRASARTSLRGSTHEVQVVNSATLWSAAASSSVDEAALERAAAKALAAAHSRRGSVRLQDGSVFATNETPLVVQLAAAAFHTTSAFAPSDTAGSRRSSLRQATSNLAAAAASLNPTAAPADSNA